MPERTSERVSRSARRASRSCWRRGSWFSVSSRRSTANASSGRDRTLTSIALSTRIRDGQLLGLARDQLVEGLLAPDHRALRWLLELGLGLLAFRAERLVLRLGLCLGLLVLDDVLGRLDHDEPGRVEARPARAAGDLQELAGLQDPLPVAVELRQPGEEHGADRHVDADAEGVGAADDGEQAGLGEGLHEAPVLGQHPGVVHADAGLHQLLQRLAEAGAEPEGPDLLGDGVLVLAGRAWRDPRRPAAGSRARRRWPA